MSAETSAIAGLRARGWAVDPGAVTVALVLLGAAIFLLIGCLRSATFAQYTVQGIALGSVYGALALALVLVYRATHVINFAQGELAMLTTYIAYELMLKGLSYWAAFAATLAIAFVLGTLLQVTVIRPVQLVADHGATQRSQMQSDLMLPAGEQEAAHQRVTVATLHGLQPGLGTQPRARPGDPHLHPQGVVRVGLERQIDEAVGR